MSLYRYAGTTTGHNIVIYKTDGPWSENTISFYDKPQYYEMQGSVSEGINESWIDFPVTKAVEDFLETPSRNYGFLLRDDDADTINVQFHSSEYTEDTELRSKLTITYEGPSDIAMSKSIGSERTLIKKTGNAYMVYSPYSGKNKVTISDIKGRVLVDVLVNGKKRWHQLPIRLSAGMHVVSIMSSEKRIIKKMLIVE